MGHDVRDEGGVIQGSRMEYGVSSEVEGSGQLGSGKGC